MHLIKPLFERVAPDDATSPEALRQSLHRVAEAASACGLYAERFIPSSVRGARGTVEFFGLFREAGQGPGASGTPEDAIAELVAEAGSR